MNKILQYTTAAPRFFLRGFVWFFRFLLSPVMEKDRSDGGWDWVMSGTNWVLLLGGVAAAYDIFARGANGAATWVIVMVATIKILRPIMETFTSTEAVSVLTAGLGRAGIDTSERIQPVSAPPLSQVETVGDTTGSSWWRSWNPYTPTPEETGVYESPSPAGPVPHVLAPDVEGFLRQAPPVAPVEAAPQRVPAPAPPLPVAPKPKARPQDEGTLSSLLSVARSQLGISETENPSRIVEYHRETKLPKAYHTPQTSWCGSFLSWVFARAGVSGVQSAAARDWLRWGKPSPKPVMGCVMVFSRGNSPSSGHVGFFVGEEGPNYLILGGNQGNKVSVAKYSKARLLPQGIRIP
jgi:uncharacterized protein (TIGR02594 family)